MAALRWARPGYPGAQSAFGTWRPANGAVRLVCALKLRCLTAEGSTCRLTRFWLHHLVVVLTSETIAVLLGRAYLPRCIIMGGLLTLLWPIT
jgi:hypothetical protein